MIYKSSLRRQLFTDLQVGDAVPNQPTGYVLDLALFRDLVDLMLTESVIVGRLPLLPQSRSPYRITGRLVVFGYSPWLLSSWPEH